MVSVDLLTVFVVYVQLVEVDFEVGQDEVDDLLLCDEVEGL